MARVGAVLALGGAGALVPLVLAWSGAQSWTSASVVASALAGLTVLCLRVVVPRRPRAPPLADSPSLTQDIRAARETPIAQDAAIPYAAMLERLADPIVLVAGGPFDDTTARRFVFANATARSLLRLQRDEGPLTMAIRAPEVLAMVDRALYYAAAGEATFAPGGPQGRVWRAAALPLPPAGSMTTPERARSLAVLTFRDETEFRRSERTRADFLANASHELRTPLASLAGFIETLRGHARDDEAAREKFLAIMHVQALRMRRLIDDLLSLSRIELGEHIPPSGKVDLAVAAIDVVDALAPLAS